MSRLPIIGSTPYHAACPDCPAGRLGVLEDLVGKTKHTCRFETATVDARALVPDTWRERYAFGLVRRGVLIRRRVDGAGDATSIDAAGPGCLFWIDAEKWRSDFAATDLIACLCPKSSLDAVLDSSTETGRELLALSRLATSRVERLAQARGARDADTRVARLLVVLAETLTPTRTRSRLPSDLQQRDLSALLGMRHETFCRVLKRLEGSGAIARSPDGLEIVDLERLRSPHQSS